MDSLKCLVCSAPITATHFGFEVCRACAAFFKRTTLSGRTYTCRQSDGQCTFRKHEQFMCRGCRHDRCLELGMEYIEPPKRKPRKKKEVEMEKTASTSSASWMPLGDSIIKRMGEVYKASHDRRMMLEQLYAAANNLKSMDHPTEELFVVNITDFYEVLRITISESRKIIEHCFDEYEHLSVLEKNSLFKNFFGRLCFVEGVYLSSRYFKNNFTFMTSLITCVDSSNVNEWVTDQDDVERKDDLRTSIQGFASEYNDLIVPLMKIEELTEIEFHALIVLAYCDHDHGLPLSVEIVENAENIRTRVLSELQDYYKDELKLTNYSKRLGNLLMVAHSAGEAGTMMCEELRMYATMFNVYANDQLICETFLN